MSTKGTADNAELSSGFFAWFVHRPIATVLLTLAIVLLGLISFPNLPIAPLPEADMPTITVTAALPGASAETMASSIATPLEVQLSAVPGIREMTSGSSLGLTSITLQFVLEKDIDAAAQEVQAAINSVAGRLPADMPSLPTWRKVNPNDSPIVTLMVQSPLLSLTELTDATETLLARQLSQIEGVADTVIVGAQRPAMRIQASPERLASLGITLADIRASLRSASVNRAKGALYGDEHVSTIDTNDQIFDPSEYETLVVAYRDGAPVRLKDVARVSMGAENDYARAWQQGNAGLQIIIRRQPGANIVATADRIIEALPRLSELMPASIEVQVLNDRTRTIRASLHEVQVTLAVAMALVILVMTLFLRQASATAIVASVLGVSLIATLAGMYTLGFSLNNLTLVALVVAVGFVVDDAIVVVENIVRLRETGLSMHDAALKGVAQIGFTVISISLSLIAAFIPLLFMGGIVGRLFREFALTMTVAILVSMLASLTLAPTLASRWMRTLPKHDSREGFFSRLLAAYDRSLRWALRHQRFMLVGFGVTLALSVLAYVYVPKGFFPEQDTAFIVATTRAAEDIPFEQMAEKHQAIGRIIGADPAVQGYAHAIGTTGPVQQLSSGRLWAVLKDRGDRDVSSAEFIDRMRPQLAAIPGIQVFMRTMQDINLGAGGGSAQYLYSLTSVDSASLSEWADRLTARLVDIPQVRDVSNDQQIGARITRLTIDRTAAARFGLTTDDIDQVLYDAFGQRQVGEYQTEVNQYKVILEIDPRQRGSIDSLEYFHLRSPLTGQMVPLSSVARLEPTATGPSSITHLGMFPSVGISFNLAPGVALGTATEAVERAAAEIGMPANIRGAFRGNAQAFADSLASQPWLILAAILAVYIILGVLYESFVHPLTILSTLPSAGLGAILALWIAGQDFSIMALIGLVLLIGIVKKNGILMVDFALELQRNDGLSAHDAIHRACLARLRPILMTTIAAMLGAVPLVIAFGTGSELRQPLGIAIVGGLLVSQILTLYSTPVVYLALDRLFHRETAREVALT